MAKQRCHVGRSASESMDFFGTPGLFIQQAERGYARDLRIMDDEMAAQILFGSAE